MEKQKVHKRYIIIGAGPAGLQLGYYFKKSNEDFVILEKNDVAGSYFKDYPRHRTLISINKVYTGLTEPNLNLRFDWNSLLSDDEDLLYKNYDKTYFPNADGMVKYLSDFAAKFELPIDYGTDVQKITNLDKFFIETGGDVDYTCDYLVVASGWVKPHIPNVPGIEHGDHYMTMSLDKSEYENKRVLILGKGNSAFETADDLIDVTAVTHISSPNSLNLAWNTHYVGHLRAVNNNFLDTYHLKSQNAILDADIKEIRKEGDAYAVDFIYNNQAGEEETLNYDKILLCTGFKFDNTIFDESCKPESAFNEKFPNQTCEFESTNVEGMYFAGTITHMRDFKKQASGFIHGFRYNAASLAKILMNKYEGRDFPTDIIDWTAEALTEKILDRININSSLWNQYGYLADVAIIKNDKVAYIDSLPKDFITDKLTSDSEEYFVVTMEFGNKNETTDHMSQTRVHRDDFENADKSVFIHPVIRFYVGNKMEQEFHIIEDLEAVWKEPIHIEPLKKFISSKKSVLEM